MALINPMEHPRVAASANRWKKPLNLDGMINCSVGFENTLLVTGYLFPTFVEIRGCVVRAGASNEEQVDSWLSSTDGDVRQTEAVINHVYLFDTFLNDDLTDDDVPWLERLGQFMVIGWNTQLAAQFPGRTFDVSCVHDPDAHGPVVNCSSSGKERSTTTDER